MILTKLGYLIAALATVLNAAPEDQTIYPFVRQAKTGFINRTGKVVIQPQFDASFMSTGERRTSSDGLYPVSKDLKWGYVDIRGALKIPFQFSLAGHFSEELAAVRVERQRNGSYESKYGYVDASGNLKIPATFDQAGTFSEGLAWVVRGSNGGYIDKTGAFAIAPRFGFLSNEYSSFSEGLAGVSEPARPRVDDVGGGVPKPPEILWGFVDHAGAWKIPPRFSLISAFHDGLAVAYENGESGGKYINHSGETIAGPFSAAWQFSEGLARIQAPGGKLSFIDRSGKIQFTLDQSVSWVEPFSEGLALATIRSLDRGFDKFGYIDRSGRFVIAPGYDSGTSFQGGLAFVSTCGQSGYIGKTGQTVWGIKAPSAAEPGQPNTAPTPAALTRERIAAIAGFPTELDVQPVKVPGVCNPFGKQIWSLDVKSKDGKFPAFQISLLEGETFLTEENMGNLTALQNRFGDTMARSIGPRAKPIGYVSVAGFGPGGAAYVASAFSSDKRYEVQVTITLGEGIPRMNADPMVWAGDVTQQVLSVLFTQSVKP